jgi:hypothetical protein
MVQTNNLSCLADIGFASPKSSDDASLYDIKVARLEVIRAELQGYQAFG